ncbi:hypothetical protein B296_00056580 [Ensete ventricosum]|uniref:Uncharacterized protein n=1 Tax=Ensete ventricosum TaxID=4639 RepID=A0A426X9I2_ENSVE|nr:hypothetical protein B296_00056580 [Ensete ventricosum]
MRLSEWDVTRGGDRSLGPGAVPHLLQSSNPTRLPTRERASRGTRSPTCGGTERTGEPQRAPPSRARRYMCFEPQQQQVLPSKPGVTYRKKNCVDNKKQAIVGLSQQLQKELCVLAARSICHYILYAYFAAKPQVSHWQLWLAYLRLL